VRAQRANERVEWRRGAEGRETVSPGLLMAKRGRGVDRGGRSKTASTFIMIPNFVFDSSAFRALKPISWALLLVIVRRFNGRNNGEIALGQREAAEALGMKSRESIAAAFDDLAAKGIIRMTAAGAFARKTKRASEWELTFHHVGNRPAAMTFKSWRPEQNSRDRNPDRSGQES